MLCAFRFFSTSGRAERLLSSRAPPLICVNRDVKVCVCSAAASRAPLGDLSGAVRTSGRWVAPPGHVTQVNAQTHLWGTCPAHALELQESHLYADRCGLGLGLGCQLVVASGLIPTQELATRPRFRARSRSVPKCDRRLAASLINRKYFRSKLGETFSFGSD